MNILDKTGKWIAEHSRMAVALVVLITLLSAASMSIFGVSMAFTEEAFMAHNEYTDADAMIGSSFTTADSFIGLTKADGNVITRDGMIATLEFEKAVYENETVNQCLIQPHDHITSIFSPADLVAAAMISQAMIDPAMAEALVMEDFNASDPLSYDNMILVLNLSNDAAVQQTVFGLMSTEQGATMASLFTNDLEVSATNANANGYLVFFSMNKETFDLEPDEDSGLVSQLELEQVMSDKAKDVNAGETAQAAGVTLSVMGFSMMSEEIMNAAMDSIMSLIPVTIVAIVIILLIVYRDIVDTLGGLLGLMIAIVWTFGIAAALGFSFNPMTIAVPILLLGLGIDYGLHIVMRYREERSEDQDSQRATILTTRSVGEALLLATITTVVAFLSNLTSTMPALREFGILCALGIICSFIVMMLLIPSVQVIRDQRTEAKGMEIPRRHRKRDDNKDKTLARIVGIGGKAATKAPVMVIVGSLIVVGLFGYGAVNISSEFDYLDFLPDGLDSTKDLNYFLDNFNATGLNTANVLVEGNASDPAIIAAMDASASNMADSRGVVVVNGSAQVTYISTVLLDWYQTDAGNETNLTMYQMIYPMYFNATSGDVLQGTSQANVTVLLGLLYAHGMSGDESVFMDLASIMGTNDDDEAVTQMVVVVADDLGQNEILDLRDDLMVDIEPIKDLGVQAIPAGGAISGAVTTQEMNQSQLMSLMITLVATWLLLTIVLYVTDKSLLMGTMATIPTLVSVIMVWGSMFFMGISLNIMTLTIASLTVGMGVTYGIHICHRFTEEMDTGRSGDESVRTAVSHTGQGVLGAAATTALGFFILAFSLLPPMQQFGTITALAIVFAFLGAVVLLPALLTLWARRKEKLAGV